MFCLTPNWHILCSALFSLSLSLSHTHTHIATISNQSINQSLSLSYTHNTQSIPLLSPLSLSLTLAELANELLESTSSAKAPLELTTVTHMP